MKTKPKVLSPKEKDFIFLMNQSFKSIILFLILSCCTNLQVHAQTPTDATLTFNSGQGTFYLAVPDSNIAEIELNIGTKAGLADVFSYTYSFDQTSGLPNGYTFTRNGLNTYLGLGAVTEKNVYNSKVRLKNTTGGWGDWYEIVSN
jgi:hypothetical protein